MYKQTKLWKGLLKDQGFVVHIAGQKKIDKVRKERVDDLFEVTEVKGNFGTEKKQYSKILVLCFAIIYVN